MVFWSLKVLIAAIVTVLVRCAQEQRQDTRSTKTEQNLDKVTKKWTIRMNIRIKVNKVWSAQKERYIFSNLGGKKFKRLNCLARSIIKMFNIPAKWQLTAHMLPKSWNQYPVYHYSRNGVKFKSPSKLRFVFFLCMAQLIGVNYCSVKCSMSFEDLEYEAFSRILG